MSLLREIQESLMDEDRPIGPIMLKLRFLASRLGNTNLEEWVKHESDGYPSEVKVPLYRKIPVSYTGTFSGPFGSGINNAQIPPYIVEKHAGSGWTNFEQRQSISAIDSLLSEAKGKSGTLSIEAGNLILLLQGKIYKDYACNDITGSVSVSSIAELRHAVRSRILELTLELEKVIPNAVDIQVGPAQSLPNAKEAEAITHITQQIVHGNVTTISNSGAGAQFNLNISRGDTQALVKALEDSGFPKNDAEEFAQIVASEEAGSKEEPLGKRAKDWFTKNIGKAVNGTWNMGISVATNVLTVAATKYYGLS